MVLHTLTLIIQTATDPAQVALMEDDQILAQHTINERLAVCREFAYEIAHLLEQSGKKMQEIGLIAVAYGPGSFTGIRIGVAAAKALAHALDTSLVGVDTLSAMAYECQSSHQDIVVCLKAGRGRYYTAHYGTDRSLTGAPALRTEQQVEAWFRDGIVSPSDTQPQPQPVLCTQSDAFLETIASQFGMTIEETGVSMAALGAIGLKKFRTGYHDDPVTLRPFYLRPSSPEERVMEQAANGR